jgi:hypothetical protein
MEGLLPRADAAAAAAEWSDRALLLGRAFQALIHPAPAKRVRPERKMRRVCTGTL